MSILASTALQREFVFTNSKGELIDLPDFNPAAPPEDVVKFYAGTYPELTNAKIEPDLAKSTDVKKTYNVSAKVGTKG